MSIVTSQITLVFCDFFFEKNVRGEKYHTVADKCKNGSPYINHFILSKYLRCTTCCSADLRDINSIAIFIASEMNKCFKYREFSTTVLIMWQGKYHSWGLSHYMCVFRPGSSPVQLAPIYLQSTYSHLELDSNSFTLPLPQWMSRFSPL